MVLCRAEGAAVSAFIDLYLLACGFVGAFVIGKSVYLLLVQVFDWIADAVWR